MKRNATANLKRVFLAMDHPVYAEGLMEILDGEPGLAVCGQAGSAEEALGAISHLKPDLILIDISLPGTSGLELLKRFRVGSPEIKILVISMREEQAYAARVLRAGGDGYVLSQQDPEEIVAAIGDVLAGHIYVSEELLASSSKISPQGPPRPWKRPINRLNNLEKPRALVLRCGQMQPGGGLPARMECRKTDWPRRRDATEITLEELNKPRHIILAL